MTQKQSLYGIGVLTLGALVAGLLLWPHLPALMATHWDMHGRVNGRMPKSAVLALMLFLTLMPGLALLLRHRFAFRQFRDEEAWDTYGYVMFLLSVLMAYTWAVILAAAVGLHFDISRAIVLPVFLFTALMANVMGRLRRGYPSGSLRRWMPLDAATDAATQRFAGRLLFAASVLGGLLVLAGVPILPCVLLLPLCSFVILTRNFLNHRHLGDRRPE